MGSQQGTVGLCGLISLTASQYGIPRRDEIYFAKNTSKRIYDLLLFKVQLKNASSKYINMLCQPKPTEAQKKRLEQN